MFKKSATVTGLAIATVASLAIASPAFAASWDGNDVTYGPGVWELTADAFSINDVDLIVDPDAEAEYTDLWDGAGETTLFADALGIEGETVYCNADADVDLTFDGASGNPIATCVAANAAFATAGLDVVSEIRVLTGGDIVRFMTTVTNTTDSSVTIDEIEVETDFGTRDALFDYENQSDDVLAVPYDGVDDVATQLNSVEARWAVNFESEDAPGGVVIGGGDPAVAGVWKEVLDDVYIASFGPFEIPAGQSRSIVTFNTWDPQTLIGGSYSQDAWEGEAAELEALITQSAGQVVADIAQFDTLTEALAVGLDPTVPVINWQQVAAEPEPELAETGPADMLGLGVLAALLLGLGVVATTRRRGTV